MSKVARIAATVVGAVALVASGVGVFAAAGTVLATTAASVATIATVTSGILTIAAVATAKKPSATSTGQQTDFSANPDAGLPYIIGRTGSAGDIIFRKGWDTADKGENDRQAFVAAHSVGPIEGFESMTVDRVLTSFSSAGAAIGQYAGYMWSLTQLGLLPTAAAIGFGSGAGSPPGWTSAHKLSGLAATSWTLRFDARDKPKLYQNGVPAPMWVVKGSLCYDPRKDSTRPGGSGPHRMADPSDTAAYDAAVATWEWSENPYLHGLKWAHGIWQRDFNTPGSTWQRVMGMGSPAGAIDVAAFVEGANVADAHGWKVGGVIYSRDPKWETLKKILQAGMGEPLTLGAKVSCLVNAPKVSLAHISAADIKGEVSVTGTQRRRSRINTITPRYRKEENNWQLLPGAPISVPEHVAEDKGKRSKAQDYAFIQHDSQAGTAVRYDIENAREFGPISVPLGLAWLGYKPGDCVTITHSETGLNAQPILLLNRDLDPGSCVVTFTARSETAAKHPFALGQVATPAPTPGLTGPALVPQPEAGSWSLIATLAPGTTVATPALVITGEIDSATADTAIFEYRVAGTTEWVGAGVEPPTITRKEIRGVDPATEYEVSVRYRARGIPGERRILGPVTTSGIDLSADAIVAHLTNENHILPADADGNVLSYAGAATEFVVYASGADVSADFALSVADNPQVLTISIVGHTAAVSAGLDVGEPGATALLRMTGSGPYAGIVMERQFNLVKSRAGADGESPPLISLETSDYVVRYNPDNTFVSGQPITFTATRQNTDVAAIFEIYNGAGEQVAGPGVPAAFVSSFPGSFTSSDPDELTMTSAGVASTMDVHGGTQGKFTVRAFIDGSDVADRVTIAKIKNGANGLNAPLVLTQWSVNGSTGWHPNFADGDIYQRQSNDNGATWGPAVKVVGDSVVGDDGITPATVFKRSATVPATPSDNTGNPPTGWSDGPPAGAGYIWQSNAKFRDATQLTSWSTPQRISGEPGADAIVGALSTVIWPVQADYNNATKAGQLPKYSTLKVMQGTTDVTGGCSVTLTPSDSGQITASYSSGTIALTKADSAGYLDVTVSYSGVAVPGSPFRIQVDRRTDPPPPGSVTGDSVQMSSAPSSPSYAGNNAVRTAVVRANASGQLTFGLAATYSAEQPVSGTRTYKPAGAAAYRVVGSSTWSYTSETEGSTATSTGGSEPTTLNGDLSITGLVITGLTPGEQYEIGAALRRVVGNASTPTLNGYFTVSQ